MDSLVTENECPVCKGAIEEPSRPSVCNHVACRGCLIYSLKERSHCPVCRAQTHPNDVIRVTLDGEQDEGVAAAWRSRRGIPRPLHHQLVFPRLSTDTLVRRNVSANISSRIARLQVLQANPPSPASTANQNASLPGASLVPAPRPAPRPRSRLSRRSADFFLPPPPAAPAAAGSPQEPPAPQALGPALPVPVAPTPVIPRSVAQFGVTQVNPAPIVAAPVALVPVAPVPVVPAPVVPAPVVPAPLVPALAPLTRPSVILRRYAPLIMPDSDDDSDDDSGEHNEDVAMQMVLNEVQLLEMNGPRQQAGSVQTFVCPYCQEDGMDELDLRDHCNDHHRHDFRPVVCPVCVSLPHGDPEYYSRDFIGHLNLRHGYYTQDFMNTSISDDINLQQALLDSYTAPSNP